MWTAERVTILRSLWEDGVFASHISTKLGVTRNAVIGKAHRLGLVKRKHAPPGTVQSNRPISATVQNRPQRAPRIARPPKVDRQKPDNVVLIHDDHATPLEQRRVLSAIKDNECHFPVGDPGSDDFFYCGAPIHGDRPYCQGHQQRMFTKPRPRTVQRVGRPFKALATYRVNSM